MKAGRLYNANSKDLEKYHLFGMETCDKFNRTPLWMKKRKQRLLEKLIPSAKFCEAIASMWKECYTDIYEVMKVWMQ